MKLNKNIKQETPSRALNWIILEGISFQRKRLLSPQLKDLRASQEDILLSIDLFKRDGKEEKTRQVTKISNPDKLFEEASFPKSEFKFFQEEELARLGGF